MIRAQSSRRAGARPTMADVARLAGVSKMTVSRALTGREVSDATQARILEAIELLGYVPNAAAGTLGTGRSGFVAALVPTINNSNFADTARGLSDALTAQSVQLLLGYTDYRIEREEELVYTMLRHRPEGVVLTGGDHSERTRAALVRSGVPVVETWDLPRDPLGQVVGFSNAAAAATMMRHLAGKGYRRIGFIGGIPGRDLRGEDRKRGYLDALRELDLGPPRLVEQGMPPITTQHGAEAIETLLRCWPDTDAALCVSDLSAFGAIMECHRRGWAVPGRIAVAGFGDFEISRSCWPSITTVGVDAYAIGRLSATILLAPPGDGETRIVVPVAVLAREST
jgi:LacI family transcriptional regulator, gluconate utilization system Gnt-I transcriptional repressor